MEEFRRIVDELRKEANDVDKYAELAQDAVVRESADLSKEETAFIKKRRQLQKIAFAKFIREDPSNIDERDIPIVGIASSGGGYRAMLGFTGYLNAMKQSGVLDCTMYMAGVSGSCWSMALYYHPFIQADTLRLKQHLEGQVNVHWANMSHFLNLLTASPQHTKTLLRGIVQRQQHHGETNLVDIFGVLVGASLFTDSNRASSLGLSSQQALIENGQEPLPIYCVVRHEIGASESLLEKMKKLSEFKSKKLLQEKDEEEKIKKDYLNVYQWFEFTPYDMGCEELEAWIPTWAFGRRFKHGRNTERVPELSLDILLGMFGSAFAASLVHFYQEVRSILPATAIERFDDTVKQYELSMSNFHPISPSSFPNPFYKLSEKTAQGLSRPQSIISSEEIHLMDAGMDNNIPFYPLLREGRNVDIIIAIDLSADIQTAPHFKRAESYIKRRGIDSWPQGAGWPKKTNQKYSLGTCTVFEGESREEIPSQKEKRKSIKLAYFPFILNERYDPEFDPQEIEFCSTWNFVYRREQVHKVLELAEHNWYDNVETMRKLLRETWEQKRRQRLRHEE
ncbi:hypothetical protein RMATCC62417_14503 [Rhizopus microsporus]|nr:hypothetical protein RMATCC62417_14503 [Rhizopus microsporus]